jgi:hypothetical protein
MALNQYKAGGAALASGSKDDSPESNVASLPFF